MLILVIGLFQSGTPVQCFFLGADIGLRPNDAVLHPKAPQRIFSVFFEVILVLCFLREKTKLGRPYKFIGALRFKGVGLSLNFFGTTNVAPANFLGRHWVAP